MKEVKMITRGNEYEIRDRLDRLEIKMRSSREGEID